MLTGSVYLTARRTNLLLLYSIIVTLGLLSQLLMPFLQRNRSPKPIESLHVKAALRPIHERHGWNVTSQTNNHIAMGCAITGRGIAGLSRDNLGQKHPFFKDLLRSFCKTASSGFVYHFYVSHDHNDPFFGQPDAHAAFEKEFLTQVGSFCAHTYMVTLQLVECGHMAKPAWAQNDAMMEAYLDNLPYYYRVNDDTVLETPGWTEAFIQALASMDPPNVGVVGPTHVGGNEAILTYDFVHRTHLDIFGFYYPRLFTDWFADAWITKVYEPQRMVKLKQVHIIHTLEIGTRYRVNYNVETLVDREINRGRNLLAKWLAAAQKFKDDSSGANKSALVYSLYGNDQKYTFGMVRNAQLAKTMYPGWIIRVYTENPLRQTKYRAVPQRIIDKLKLLGVEVIYVSDHQASIIPPMMWRFLAADDVTLDWFVIRDADSRLSEREAVLVKDWLKSGKPFHCIRDHPSHSHFALSGGMFGAKPAELKEVFPQGWERLMAGYKHEYLEDMNFLNKVVWPQIQNASYCHDSFSCKKFPGAHPFLVRRREAEHVGQVFDEFDQPRKGDMDLLAQNPVVTECVLPDAPLLESIDNPSLFLPPAKMLPQSYLDVTLTPFRLSSPITAISVDVDILPALELKSILEPMGVEIVTRSVAQNCHITNSCVARRPSLNHNDLGSVELYLKNEEFYNKSKIDICLGPLTTCANILPPSRPVIAMSAFPYNNTTSIYPPSVHIMDKLSGMASKLSNTVGCWNLYQSQVFEYYTGINLSVIRPLCIYLNHTYSPTLRKFLVISQRSAASVRFIKQLNETLGPNTLEIKEMTDQLYNYSQVVTYSGVIYIPHTFSSWLFIELYRMNIPLFVPSIEFIIKLHMRYGLISLTPDVNPKQQTLDKINTDDMPNPADLDGVETFYYWLMRTDYYRLPYVESFDSVSELSDKLSYERLNTISSSMKAFNRKSYVETITLWQEYVSQFDIVQKH